MSAAVQRTTFTVSRSAEFCSQRELVASTGTAPADWPLMIVRELVDNALDHAEESGIAPKIWVAVARGRIRVRDNGRGIPPETVSAILDFSARTSSRASYVSPSRGQQGNALSTIIAIPFALSVSGEAARAVVEARGVRHEITFRADQIAQAPAIEHRQRAGSVRTGTSVTVWWPESACSQLAAAGRRFLPLLSRYTDLNPHLTIRAILEDEDRRERWACEAIAPEWTKWVPSAPTSPHWYRAADLARLAAAFMAHYRQHKTARLLRDFLVQFDGLSGTGKRAGVLAALDLQRAPLERLLREGTSEFDHHLVKELLEAMQAAARRIKPERLGALGRDNVAAALEGYGADVETFRYKLLKGVDDGVPWIAEAAFAYLHDAERRQLIAGLNWSPALNPAGDHFQLGSQLSAAYCGPQEPIIVLAHLICPRPEFIDRGKTNLASSSPGFAAVEVAVEHVVKDWTRQRRSEISDRAREWNRQQKLRVLCKVKLSLKDAVLKHLPAVIETTSSGGRLTFVQRDLFYGIRPLVQAEQDKTLTYGYFTALLTEIEAEQGEIAGLQREARGTLYHPHLREEIPLSTETVAAYRRPFWTFNKLLYIEKAGTQRNLIELGWPEEHDCAVASVAGFTTRALKDLVDLMATSSEPITVFCVHDADAAGTMIFETLQRETRARGARKIEVVNIGLEPWEAIEEGLEPERVEPTEKRRPVAAYVAEHDRKWRSWLQARDCASWGDWLQVWRVELNAMPPADRVGWLTEKIEDHPPRKVIPPPRVLSGARRAAARQAIIEELTVRARIEERAEEILGDIEWPTPERHLPEIARRYLARFRAERWADPMQLSGGKVAERVLKKLLPEEDEQ